jgi:hypothetical protein
MGNVNTDQLTICPSCGAPMHLSRIVPPISVHDCARAVHLIDQAYKCAADFMILAE